MIVCNARCGQMSNRLYVAAHVLAYALERGESVLFTEMEPLKPLFACSASLGIKVSLRKSLFWELERRTLGRAVNWLIRRKPYLQEECKRCIHLPGLTIVSGWLQFRCAALVQKHRAAITDFLRPRLEETQKTRLRGLLSSDKVNIGVHIRRGDYRTWSRGKYFYTDATYAAVMKQLAAERDCRFLLFSDGPLEARHFEGFDAVVVGGSAVEDQWLMSQCDYLIGPPSTFSGWASYCGKVPRFRLIDPNTPVSLADFITSDPLYGP